MYTLLLLGRVSCDICNPSPSSSVVLTVLMSRILDLETEDWELDDNQMVVTVFQYSSYFVSQAHGRYDHK